MTGLGAAQKVFPRSSAFMELGPKICPPNNYCSEDGLIYHICPHGTYPKHGGCTDCSQGFMCLTSFAREVSLTPGSVSSAKDSFPRSVPQGYLWKGYTNGFITTRNFKAAKSSKGRVLLSTAVTLYSCPMGYSCTVTNYARCPSSHLGRVIGGESPGVYLENQGVLHNYDYTASVTMSKAASSDIDQSDTQCIACNEGYSCTLGSVPVPCPAGTYSPVAVPYCIICPPGHYCGAKEFQPSECAVNTFNDKAGKTIIGNCLPCQAGFYAHTGSSICDPCPVGQECLTGSPTLCPVGTYSTEGEMVCTPCQEGYACGKGSTIKTPPEALCKKGSYCRTVGGVTLETQCPAGTYGIGEG